LLLNLIGASNGDSFTRRLFFIFCWGR